MTPDFEYLPADLFGLDDLQREALSANPTIERLPGLTIPRQMESVPVPVDPFDLDERADLAAKWELELSRLSPHVAVLDSVRAFAEPRTFALLIQSPPHFCGGPLSVVYRVIHAIRTAKELSKKWNASVIPVLWNDSDGHDLAPVRDLQLLNENFDLRRITPAGLGSNRHPISRIPLESNQHRLSAIRELLRQEFVESAHRDEAIEAAFPRDGETLANAFTRWLLTVFGHLGLLVIEPDWVREELSRALAEAVSKKPPHGFEQSDNDDDALLYRVTGEGRFALNPGGDGYRFDSEVGSRTPSELAAVIVQNPSEWSSGPHLLPVLQERVMPVAARIGTWAQWKEIVPLAEFRAQFEPGTIAPFIPALRATLIEPEIALALTKSELSLLKLLKSPPKSDSPKVTKSAPVSLKMRAISSKASAELRALREETANLDRGLSTHLKRTARKLDRMIDELAQRMDRCHANQGGHTDRRLRILYGALLPHNRPQEEVLSSLPLLARYGRSPLLSLVDAVDCLPTEHLVIRLARSQGSPSYPE
ncbi:MAG: hypothetical protein ACI8TQ_000889 [Planctomycetota bacterium]|jgi:uncharacterized protein YllA (UPF0747 family)